MCVRMKISNLDANNIRSFDRVQAVMLPGLSNVLV